MAETPDPREVTADRLMDHLERYKPDDGELRDEIGRVREWLFEVADGTFDDR